MKVSLNTVKQLVNFELPPVNELVRRINERLGGVEEVIDLGAKYKGIVIAKVVKCEPHPDSDHLHVCEIDPGNALESRSQGVKESSAPNAQQPALGLSQGPTSNVQVVCGAPNVHAGMFVAWLPPGTTVPASYDKDPFVLGVRKLRGVESNGMLASPAELGIGDNHDGILELTEEDLPVQLSSLRRRGSRKEQGENVWIPDRVGNDGGLRPGMDFAETFGLNDTIIDIENKMFTHRPDCFGQLGVAREIAGILGHRFTSPEWYGSSSHESPSFAKASVGKRVTSHEAEALKLTVFNEASEKVPRFMAVVLRDVTIKPSPFWLQCELVRMGSKPINNVVDLTNYLMLLTAQPTHAYDYDKLRSGGEESQGVNRPSQQLQTAGESRSQGGVPTLGVRMAKDGEKLSLLNGKTYELTADDIVIVDGEGSVGLGGVMGGGNSEVSVTTKNIVLECATFDMYAVRKTSMRHGLFTDAVTRFNKGQSPLQNPFVLAKLQQLIAELSGGVQASQVYDVVREDIATRTESLDGANPITLAPQFIRERLGIDMKKYDMVQLLGNVEFPLCEDCGWNPEDAVDNNEPLHVNIPFWRTDVELPEDVVEEIGRLYGFDKLPHELPERSIRPAPQNVNLEMKRNIGRLLSSAGANEVKTYSFVHERVLKGAGQDPTQAFRLGNALSPDLQYYRLSLTPSLLAHVHSNIKAGHDQFALYEFGKAHRKDDVDEEGLPREYERLAFVYAAKKPQQAAYYTARRFVEAIAPDLHYTSLAEFDPGEHAIFAQLAKPYEPQRSAVLMYGDAFVGVIGEFTTATCRGFKLPEGAAGFELFQSYLRKVARKPYQPLSRFPHVTQDISLKVPVVTPYAELFAGAETALSELRSDELSLRLNPLGIYQAEGSETKTITFRLTASHYQRTLTDAEVTTYFDRVAEAAAFSCHAERT